MISDQFGDQRLVRDALATQGDRRDARAASARGVAPRGRRGVAPRPRSLPARAPPARRRVRAEAPEGRGRPGGRRGAHDLPRVRPRGTGEGREDALPHDGESKERRMSPNGRPPRKLGPDGEGEQGAVTLRFLGAARTTTGSLHRLRTEEGDVLLECGMYQGHREESGAGWNRRLPVDVTRVGGVRPAHAHIDHCGALPALAKAGFRGEIWTTPATADLLPDHALRLGEHPGGRRRAREPLARARAAEAAALRRGRRRAHAAPREDGAVRPAVRAAPEHRRALRGRGAHPRIVRAAHDDRRPRRQPDDARLHRRPGAR